MEVPGKIQHFALSGLRCLRSCPALPFSSKSSNSPRTPIPVASLLLPHDRWNRWAKPESSRTESLCASFVVVPTRLDKAPKDLLSQAVPPNRDASQPSPRRLSIPQSHIGTCPARPWLRLQLGKERSAESAGVHQTRIPWNRSFPICIVFLRPSQPLHTQFPLPWLPWPLSVLFIPSNPIQMSSPLETLPVPPPRQPVLLGYSVYALWTHLFPITTIVVCILVSLPFWTINSLKAELCLSLSGPWDRKGSH